MFTTLETCGTQVLPIMTHGQLNVLYAGLQLGAPSEDKHVDPAGELQAA
jgi:hypothetical protein